MPRGKPMSGHKHGMVWQHTLEGGPYDGLTVRVLEADPTVTFFDGLIVYERQLWLDDDGRPVMVTAKRAKKDGGDFEATGYRYVHRDTGVRFDRLTTLRAIPPDGIPVTLFEQTVVWADGTRHVDEWRHDRLTTPD